MSTQLHFDDHAGFQRAAIYWTVAGAGGALLGLLGRGMFGVGVEHMPEFMFGLAGAGIGAATGLLDRGSALKAAAGAGIGLALGVAMALLGGISALGAAGPLIGAAVAGAGLGLLFGVKGAPAPARAVGHAIAAVIGFYVIQVLMLGDTAFEWLALPGIREAAAGAVMGLFLSLGGAVGRVRLDADPVHQLWNEKREGITGDLKDLAERVVELYDEVMTRVARRRNEMQTEAILADTERVASETTQRLIRLAERWCTIETTVDKASRPRLEARLAALREKIDKAKDSVVRAEYQAAAASLEQQLSSFERIDVARERLIARIHRCHTSLEQVSVTLLQMSTTDAQNASMSLQPELERLDEMSEEFSWNTLSVEDLCNLDGEPALAPLDPEESSREVETVVEDAAEASTSGADAAARLVALREKIDSVLDAAEPAAAEPAAAPAAEVAEAPAERTVEA